ncbi:hypothetical protein A5753_07755 [Mycobacterium sp. 852002-51971_SCH5477799-a]|uniref:hypothetical protein n=1 Tax=Mycobacterium sp. 852002-51971_SCH5477799-a TaxID=1834106 RepID=UPI0007FDCE55|nr:hypothetical protein [Mycobacterium sp. 852002-51971_SCH5477799-a]OBF65682.1 hypothetical protein A5753_07755 [Mycobacterium sp. 852002-51971_SCH5477799-a]
MPAAPVTAARLLCGLRSGPRALWETETLAAAIVLKLGQAPFVVIGGSSHQSPCGEGGMSDPLDRI